MAALSERDMAVLWSFGPVPTFVVGDDPVPVLFSMGTTWDDVEEFLSWDGDDVVLDHVGTIKRSIVFISPIAPPSGHLTSEQLSRFDRSAWLYGYFLPEEDNRAWTADVPMRLMCAQLPTSVNDERRVKLLPAHIKALLSSRATGQDVQPAIG